MNDNEKIKKIYEKMKLKSAVPEPETLGHLGKKAIPLHLDRFFPTRPNRYFTNALVSQLKKSIIKS